MRAQSAAPGGAWRPNPGSDEGSAGTAQPTPQPPSAQRRSGPRHVREILDKIVWRLLLLHETPHDQVPS